MQHRAIFGVDKCPTTPWMGHNENTRQLNIRSFSSCKLMLRWCPKNSESTFDVVSWFPHRKWQLLKANQPSGHLTVCDNKNMDEQSTANQLYHSRRRILFRFFGGIKLSLISAGVQPEILREALPTALDLGGLRRLLRAGPSGARVVKRLCWCWKPTGFAARHMAQWWSTKMVEGEEQRYFGTECFSAPPFFGALFKRVQRL